MFESLDKISIFTKWWLYHKKKVDIYTSEWDKKSELCFIKNLLL